MPNPGPGTRGERRTALKVARTAALAFIVLLALLVLTAILSARPGNPQLYPSQDTESVSVYVVRNWLHANLAVPRRQLREASSGPAAAALDRLPPGDWVLIGWGDAKHYRERGDSPERRRSLIRSLVVPDNRAVILLDAEPVAPTPEETGRRILELELSPEGFRRLARRLDQSFALAANGVDPLVAGRGRAPDSLFFHCVETADLFFACNHWIGDLLDAAGVPTTPFVDTITFGLAWNLKLRARAEDLPGTPGEGSPPGLETPPAHSGRFDPISNGTQDSDAVVFEDYAINLGEARLQTRPTQLAAAGSISGPDGRTWSQILNVPPSSLVEHRQVVASDPAPGLCDSDPVTDLVVGFRVTSEERYEMAMATLSGARLCGVAQYLQP